MALFATTGQSSTLVVGPITRQCRSCYLNCYMKASPRHKKDNIEFQVAYCKSESIYKHHLVVSELIKEKALHRTILLKYKNGAVAYLKGTIFNVIVTTKNEKEAGRFVCCDDAVEMIMDSPNNQDLEGFIFFDLKKFAHLRVPKIIQKLLKKPQTIEDYYARLLEETRIR